MGNETERKTQHDSQILQVSVMWFKKWRIRQKHNKVLSNFCHQKKSWKYFRIVYITMAYSDSKSTIQFPGRNQINFTLFSLYCLRYSND